jgi:tetratricopeptide (TPR) repeat protein
MRERHIQEELFGRFLRGDVSKDEARKVVQHLLSACPECAEMTHRVTLASGIFGDRPPGTTDWEHAYKEAFTRALAFATEAEQQIALEKLRGWAQWATLEPMNPQLRFEIVEEDTSYQTYGFYSRLLEAGSWTSRREPSEAVDIFRLAIIVAEQLTSSPAGERRAADLRAHAWAALGNAKRIADDFEGARQAFNEAWRILEDGTGDPEEEAHLISLEASYMKAIGEFELAESSLIEAYEQYQRAGDTPRQGRVLLQMGDIIGHVNPERGISHLRKALALIDVEQDPRLDLCAKHDLALYLTESGQPEEALAVLERARPLYRRFKDDLTQLRLHWLEGKIAHGLGEYQQAESIFSQLWDEFRALNLNQEVVLVTIDLAEALTQKGEPARAAELTAGCYNIMKNWGLHKDALAAWLVFQDALAQGLTTENLFHRVSEYYRRHWVRPGAFES